MKEYNKSLSTMLAFSIILTLFFPLGIFGIVFGAVRDITALLGVGIGMTVVAFYGTPIMWTNFGDMKKMGSVLKLIENENFYSVSDIAIQLAEDEAWVEKTINKLIEKGFLQGYIYKNGTLTINNNVRQVRSSETKCPNCGGKLTTKDGQRVCEYCGTTFNK